jgi:hypothetical protein
MQQMQQNDQFELRKPLLPDDLGGLGSLLVAGDAVTRQELGHRKKEAGAKKGAH